MRDDLDRKVDGSSLRLLNRSRRPGDGDPGPQVSRFSKTTTPEVRQLLVAVKFRTHSAVQSNSLFEPQLLRCGWNATVRSGERLAEEPPACSRGGVDIANLDREESLARRHACCFGHLSKPSDQVMKQLSYDNQSHPL